jgi:CubicO group peptidase (beta-lactamase class C family)
MDLNMSIGDLLKQQSVPVGDGWRSVTVKHLLLHQGGFDRAISGDPMFWRHPPCPSRLRALSQVRLDFEPGQHFAYSNLGYCLVGLSLETVTGKSISELRDTYLPELPFVQIKHTGDLKAFDIDLHYADEAEREAMQSFRWEDNAATGALAGTARDFGMFLGRLVNQSDGIIGEAGESLFTPLPGCDDRRWRTCHGLAFYSYQEEGLSRMFWRDGSLPGVTAFAAVMDNGDRLVLLGNSRSRKWKVAHDQLGIIVYRNLAKGDHNSPGRATLAHPPQVIGVAPSHHRLAPEIWVSG